jgi:hypothetical protein
VERSTPALRVLPEPSPNGRPVGNGREGISTSAAPTEEGPPPPRKRTARDDLFDVVAASFEEPPKGKSAATRIGKIVSDLVDLGASPDEYKIRWERYKRKWPTWTRTPEAVVKHWPDLSGGPQRPESMFNGARLDEHAARRM